MPWSQPLRPLAVDSESPADAFAAYQRSLLLMMLYANDQRSLSEAFPSDEIGRVRDFVFEENSLPPSFLVIESTTAIDFVVGGYSDASAMLRSFVGYIGEPSDLIPNSVHNAFWYHAFLEIRERIDDIVDHAVVTKHLRFAGHSYGALVALYAAIRAKSLYINRRVEWLGLGAAKGLTRAPAVRLDVCVRIATEEDPIARMPEDSSVLTNPLLPEPLANARNKPWIHLGSQSVINAVPKMNEAPFAHPSAAYWLLNLGIEQCFRRHSIGIYAERLGKWSKSIAGTEEDEAFLQQQLLPEKRLRDKLSTKPIRFPVPLPDVTTFAAANAVYYAGQVVIETVEQLLGVAEFELNILGAQAIKAQDAYALNALSLEALTVAAPADAYKVTLSFSTPQEDNWHELYFCQGSLSEIQRLFLVSSPLMVARLAMLNIGYTLVRIRFTALGGTRASTSRSVYAAGTSGVAGQAYPASVAAIAKLASTSAEASRHVFLSGLSKPDILFQPTGRLYVLPSFQSNFNAYVAAMAGSVVKIPFLKKRTLPGFQARAVGFVDGSVPPFATLTVIGDSGLHPLLPANPKRIVLGRFPAKLLPGFNGRYDVVGTDDAQHVTIRYTVPGGQGIPVDTGTMRIEEYDWSQGPSVANSEIVSLNHRDRKNADSGSRGRQRATVRRNSP